MTIFDHQKEKPLPHKQSKEKKFRHFLLLDKYKPISHKSPKEKTAFFVSLFVVLLALSVAMVQPEHLPDFIFAVVPTAIELLLKKQ